MKEKIFLENNRILEEDEYLLKIMYQTYDGNPKGFLTKLNQDNSIPVRFNEWKGSRFGQTSLPFSIVKQGFQDGWKIHDARYGESTTWAILLHPDGYTIEIYMNHLINLLKKEKVEKGIIIGKYKWHNHNLIKE